MSTVAGFVALMFLVGLCGAIYLAYDVYQYNQRIKRGVIAAFAAEPTSRLHPEDVNAVPRKPGEVMVTTHRIDGTTTHEKVQVT